MDAKTTQIFHRYLNAKFTGDLYQQGSIRRHRRRYIFVSCFRRDDQTNRAQPTSMGKRGFNEGFEWTLKQDGYFADI